MTYQVPKTQPNEWTESEKVDAAKHLAATYTFRKLRQMQAVNKMQTATAFYEKKTKALERLQAMTEVYAMAVDIQHFAKK